MRSKANNKKILRRVITLIALIAVVTTSITIGYYNAKSARGAGENGEVSLQENVDAREIDVPIIMYHSVNTYKPGAYIVTPKTFESDIIFLQNAGYTPVFLSDLTNFVASKSSLPRKPVLITLDDGFYNNYSNALPIALKRNAKIVFSFVGKYVDGEKGVATRRNTYSYVNDFELAKMRESGLVEFCNHTYDLHHIGRRKGARPVANEPINEYEKMLMQDTKKCEAVAARNGIKFSGYTYPYGYYTKLTENILAKNGYQAMLTCTEGINKLSVGDYKTLMSLKRFNRPSGISSDKFFIETCKLSLVNPR